MGVVMVAPTTSTSAKSTFINNSLRYNDNRYNARNRAAGAESAPRPLFRERSVLANRKFDQFCPFGEDDDTLFAKFLRRGSSASHHPLTCGSAVSTAFNKAACAYFPASMA